MPSSNAQTTLRVALIGNPNTGKSTLFSALAGLHQRVGNYPGVTVEKKTGRMEHAGRRYELVDLPGLYSLAPRSRDEMVAVDVLLGRGGDSRPVDAVVCIVDAGNLERNLYLVSQVLELGLPTVLALNMLDVANRQGISVDVDRLRQHLPIPVVPLQANRRIGVAQLKAALAEITAHPMRPCESPLADAVQGEVTRLEPLLANGDGLGSPGSLRARCLAQRLLLDGNGYLERTLLSSSGDQLGRELAAARSRLAQAGCNLPAAEITARYDWACRVLQGVVTQPGRPQPTATDRIDRLLTHRFWGTLVLGLVMVGVFQAVFGWAEPLTRWLDQGVEAAGAWLAAWLSEGALRSLLLDGVVRGVGGVLAFLPQIAVLFCFIAILEDCGYMARAAYLMDRIMVRVGLSGKSFLPMLSSFGCAIPGIMAARVVDSERDRLTTILVAPLLTCSARLPVYALLIAAFIPARSYLGGLLNLRGLVLTGLYVLGIVTAVAVALALKRTVLRGDAPLFLMELPSYKWPSLRTIFFRVLERVLVFVRCAGSLILAVSILTWAAVYYPHSPEAIAPLHARWASLRSQLGRLDAHDRRQGELTGELTRLEHQIDGQSRRQSILGRLGRLIEPAVKPLGWDWRIGCAVIASFPAREVVVATMGVIFSPGEDLEPKSGQGTGRFRARLQAATWDGTDKPLFTVPVALSIMVFFALCAQCVATLAVIKRETNSWRWPAFTFAYMTTLAYLGALGTYQFGTWISMP